MNIFTKAHNYNKQAKESNPNEYYLKKIQEILKLASKCDISVIKNESSYSIHMRNKNDTHSFHLPFRFSNIINQLI